MNQNIYKSLYIKSAPSSVILFSFVSCFTHDYSDIWCVRCVYTGFTIVFHSIYIFVYFMHITFIIISISEQIILFYYII